MTAHRTAAAATTARRRWSRVGLTAVMVGLAVHPGLAQTVEDLRSLSIEQLGRVEITSVSKSTERLSDAAAAVYVISHDDIVRSGYTTLPDILRLAPNLEVAQISATRFIISARGFNVSDNASMSNKLLVLIDGRSVYTPMFGGVYWDMQVVPPEDIDRIEVISGPGATLWGANAVNGVVNIITRPSNETQGGVLTLNAGTLQRGASMQYGGRLSPDLTYRVHGSLESFSAFQQSNGQSSHDGWSRPQGGFRLDWTPSDDAVSLQGDLYTVTEDPNGFLRGNDVMATWQHRFDNGSALQLLAYYDDAERYLDSGGGGFTVRTYDIEMQHNFQFGHWNSIVWGAGSRTVRYTFLPVPPGLFLVPDSQTLELANVFAQDTISLLSNLKLTLGLKLEDEPYAGLQTLPSVRLAWKPTDPVLLWGAVSRAVRSPTPVDVALREYVGTADILNGSSGFRPETMTAYEVGTRVSILPRASFSISGFYDVYDDLRSIGTASATTLLPLHFGNLMSGNVFGLEVWGNYQVTSWWRLSAGFTVQHEDLRFLPGSLNVAGLAFVADDPGHHATLHSAINLGEGVTWDAEVREMGPLPHPAVPGYVEVDSRLGWDVTPRLQLSLAGFNLLHARHMEFIEGSVGTYVPRSVLAQARVRF
jgi:iron complex outermembrane receptor protein